MLFVGVLVTAWLALYIYALWKVGPPPGWPWYEREEEEHVEPQPQVYRVEQYQPSQPRMPIRSEKKVKIGFHS